MTARGRRLHERLIATRAMPEGPKRVAATEAVVADIEASGERALLPLGYHSLIWAYHRGGELEKAFTPFQAELHLFDDEPELFGDEDVHRLLWSFKWMTAGLWKFPWIPRERIDALVDDMERRYRAAGQGMSAVLDIRLAYATHRGDWAAAEVLHRAALECERDALSDCAACTANERAAYQVLSGDDAGALTLLDTVIVDGLSCATEPHGSLGTALLPFVRLGRLDDARAAHLKGYRLVRGKLVFQSTIAEHIEFLARTGNETRGLEILTAHSSMFTEQDHPLARLTFLTAAGLLLRRVCERGGGDTTVPGPTGPSTATVVAEWAESAALELAGQFDVRNGTDRHTDRARSVLEAGPLVRSLRLGVGEGRTTELSDAPPIGVTAELIGAEGLDEEALVRHAEDLAAMGHPATGPLWEAIGERVGPDADPLLLAKIDDGIGRTVSTTDPFAGRERLTRALELWAEHGDEHAVAIARSRAAVAAALTGEHDVAIGDCAAAGDVLARLGTPLEQLHHLYRSAYVRLATAADADGRAEAAALFRQHTARAVEMGAVADAAQSRIVLLDHLDEPSDPAAAAAVWLECAQAARESGREWWLPHIYVRLAQARLAAGWFPERVEQVLGVLTDAVRLAEGWGEGRPAAYACYLRGELLGELEQYDEALAAAFEAVTRAEDAGMEPLAVEARLLLGSVYHELERDHEAAEYLELAAAALIEGDPQMLFRVEYRLGVSLHRLGDLREAAEHLSDASEIAEEAGVLGSAAHAAHLAGSALDSLEPAAAAEYYGRSARLFQGAGEGQGVVRMYRAQAASLAEAGRYDDALAALNRAGMAAEALAPAEDVDPKWERAEVDDQSARVLAMAGRGVDAVHRALSAEQRHIEADAPADAAHAAALAAQVTLELLDDPDAAEPVARRAVAHADASHDESAHTSAVLALAAVLDGQGRGDEAARLRASVGVDDEDHPTAELVADFEIGVDRHLDDDDGDDEEEELGQG